MRSKVATAIPALIEALLDPNPKLGESALWALKYCSPDSVAPLVTCLAHPQAFVRERSAHSLGNIGEEARSAVPLLIKLLSDEDQAVRRRAAWAIGLTRDVAVASDDEHVVNRWLDALGHPSPIVRSALARALAKTGDVAVPRLRSLVASRGDLRNALAAFALGEMGPIAASALPELRAGMKEVEEPLSSYCAIAIALVSGDAEALPFLIGILRSNDSRAPRRAAASAIARLGPGARAAEGALEALLDDEDYEIGDVAQAALASVRGARH